MTNWQTVIGHTWAAQLLAEAITHGRTSHAYLITGPEQVGKTTLARLFAQALNCEAAPAERPCGRCRACALIAGGRHPDVRLVLPEISGRGKHTLKIEAIRELQQGLSLAAYEARTKVAILKRFDAATVGAANAFLKTLEEPPHNVMLLLTANDADTLLPTIASRCRTIGLRPLPASVIEESLITRWQTPPEQARLLAHLADGRLGWAVQATQEPAILQERAANLAYLYEALAGSRVRRFELADRLTRKPETLPDTLKTWLSWWRDLMLLTQQRRSAEMGQTGTDGRPVAPPLTNIDQLAQLEPLARAWTAERARQSVQQTGRALWQLEHNANARLVLENLFLTYPLSVTN
jgi:DNA polymerase III subunit delta'